MQGQQYNQAVNSHAIAVANKGFTLKPSDLTTPSSGYIVSIEENPIKIPETDFDVLAFTKAFNAKAAEINGKADLYVGGWLSEGVWYIEMVQVVASRADAIFLGTSLKQQAVWDVVNKSNIWLAPYYVTNGDGNEQQ